MLLNKIYQRIHLDADTKFITIAFIKIFIAKTLILWLAVLLAGEGRGTYVQFPIFYGWLFLPALFQNEWVKQNLFTFEKFNFPVKK